MCLPSFRAADADAGAADAPPCAVRLQELRRLKPSREEGGNAQAVVHPRMLLAEAVLPRQERAAIIQPHGFEAVHPRQRPQRHLQRGRVAERLLVEHVDVRLHKQRIAVRRRLRRRHAPRLQERRLLQPLVEPHGCLQAFPCRLLCRRVRKIKLQGSAAHQGLLLSPVENQIAAPSPNHIG